jgi:hypothetical protein
VITTRRVVISLILAGSLTLFVWSFTRVRPTTSSETFSNRAVVGVSPNPGNLVLRQSSVAVTLAKGFSLDYTDTEGLAIGVPGSSTPVPQDQLQIAPADPGQTTYTFAPGSGQTISELPAGRVCVDIVIQQTNNVAAVSTPFNWCFSTQ